MSLVGSHFLILAPQWSEWPEEWGLCLEDGFKYKYRNKGDEWDLRKKDCDECADSEDHCDHLCKNIEGSYICSCREGYQADGGSCVSMYLMN